VLVHVQLVITDLKSGKGLKVTFLLNLQKV